MHTIQILKTSENIPNTWDDINHNVFLSKRYLTALHHSLPNNMLLFYVSFFENDVFIGKALFQCISIYKTQTLGNKEHCVKRKLKNIALKKLCGNVLFLGNNMLTGQNAFVFDAQVSKEKQLDCLSKAQNQIKNELKQKGMTMHLHSFKDFDYNNVMLLKSAFEDYYVFNTQPNMVFTIRDDWHTFDDYIKDLSKKYRLQYNRARNKMHDVTKKKLSLEDIKNNESKINELYLQVVENASFNTFILPENHFYQMKKYLGEELFVYGYFHHGQMVGFSTLIKNGQNMDTYFLGYDAPFQKTNLLYLNMVYDMVAFSINQKFEKVVFGRTAMEIKSSIGAKPQETYGLVKHKTALLQNKMDKLFKYFDPKVSWIERHPFKD